MKFNLDYILHFWENNFCVRIMAWSSGRNNSCPKQRVSDEDSSSDDDNNPLVSKLLKNCSFQNGVTWSAEKNSGCLKQRVSDEDSSSDDNRFVSKLLKHSYPNGSCSHSNCAKNRSPLEDNIAPVLCPNVNPRPCSSSCNLISICGGISHNSGLQLAVKRSNHPSLVGNSAPLSMPPSNSRVGKSLNTAPANAHSVRGSTGVVTQPLCSASGSISTINEAAAIPVSSGARLVLVENNLAHNGGQIIDGHRPLELPCNKESIITRASNMELDSVSQLRSEKLSNFQSNNTSGHGGTSGPLYNWQATMTTVKERFAFLFNNEILSDIHFRVGKGESSQRIPAHRFVLAVGSAVFDAMFFGKLCTQQEEIELPDVEPQAFLSLLRFLYSDEVQIGPEIVMTVLYTAKKYGVSALERHCVEYLKSNLSPDNAFMLLTQARLFDEPQLAALCLETIDKNTSDALLADGFTDIDHSTLCMVLERDTLRIREAKLFQAVVRWSETKCIGDGIAVSGVHQREVLGDALSLIRFPLMTIEEFAQGPAQSDILTDKEIVQLFLYFTVNPKPSVNFLDIPRCCMTGKEQTVCRFQQIEARWGYSGTSDRIRFIVDRRIFVVGFGMYGSIHGPSEYEVTIQIIHTGTGKVCVSNDTSFISDGTMNTFRVMFKEPFEVLPNTNYTAYATLKGPDSHYGTKGVRKVSVECPSGDRVTFQFTYAAGNNNGTSVEDGQIPEIIFYT